jgi:hypothetical protein
LEIHLALVKLLWSIRFGKSLDKILNRPNFQGMSGCLQINSQKWKLRDADGLKLFLPRAKLESAIYFQADWSFVPPEVEVGTLPADAPKLRLRLIGFVPGLCDWRDLENLYLGYHDRIDGNEPSETRGPDMWLFQPGATSDPECGKWETDLKFGERHGHEFDFSLEAIKPSERASKFRVDNHVKQFFNQPVPPDWELPEWINEGDRLSFEGRVEFRETVCSVPINSAQPVEWATQLARRELALEQFGPCRVSGGDQSTGDYKPGEGIIETGRLVKLQMPTG